MNYLKHYNNRTLTTEYTTHQLINMYLNGLDLRETTIRTYRNNLNRYLTYLQDYGINQPTRDDIIHYRDGLRDTNKPSTVQGYITALKSFYEWAEVVGLYPNISKGIRGATLSAEHKKDALTSEEAKKLLLSPNRDTPIGKRDYAILLLMILGGLRVHEVTGITLDDIRGTSTGYRIYIKGKGRDDKSDYIKVVPELEKALLDYLKVKKPNGPYLFTAQTARSNQEGLSPRTISGMVKSYLKTIGLDRPTLTAHSLRHTAVTLALKQGLSLEEVKQYARHKSINTTLIYAHHLEREKSKAEELIRDSLF